MASPAGTRLRGRVLVGTTGDDDDWEPLQAHLKSAGWRVDVFIISDDPDREGPEEMLPRLAGVDMAILIVGQSQVGVGNPPIRNLIHLAGVLQGKLGYQRVLMLVDDGVTPFLTGTGVPEQTFSRGDLKAHFPKIDAKLAQVTAVQHRTADSRMIATLDRFGLSQSGTPPEYWLVLGVLVVLAALAGVAAFQAFAGPVEVASSDGGAGGDAEIGSDVGGDGAAGPSIDSDPAGGLGLGVEEGRVDGLPARCTIATGQGEIVPSVVDCEGIGGLRTDGFLGPWHSEISDVSMDPGVVGEVFIGPSADAASETRVRLVQPTRQSLEPYNSLSGVERLVFEFSANNQRVTLHQRGDRGGAELTLTFTLDL